MVNYNNSKIYKIVCDETNTTYFGSTTQTLSRRLNNHKEMNNTSMTKYMTNPKIYLVEDFKCERKEQLLQRERYFIENNECINKFIPIKNEEEKKETRNIYREKNKEKIKEQQRINYLNNKDRYIKHYLDNEEKIKLRRKQYYKDNIEEIRKKQNQKFNCNCGGRYTLINKLVHQATNKHKKYLDSLK